MPKFEALGLQKHLAMSDKSQVSSRFGFVDPPLPRLGPFARPQRSAVTALLLLSLFIALGLWCSVCGPVWARTVASAAALHTPADFVSLVAAFFMSVILHEAGHLVAASVLRFDIMAVNLGPARYSQSGGIWSFEWKSSGWLSASVAAVPSFRHRGDEDRWRRDMVLVVAAGPLATFLAMLLPMFLLQLTGPGSSGRTAVALLAELNAVLFIVNLIPNGKAAKVRNDASLLLALITMGAEGREILLYQMLVQVTLSGFRPCFYPQRLIREMALARTRPDFAVIFSEAIACWAWDRDDLVTAQAWFERARDAAAFCDERLANRAYAQSACFSLLALGDRTEALTHLDSLRTETIAPPWLRFRTAAVRAAASGNRHLAETESRRAYECLPCLNPYFEFETKLLGDLKRISRSA